jgi:hypothetical protein
MGFGHRVIGREAAAAEAAAIATGRRSFGHRVVGGSGPTPQAPARVRGNAPPPRGEAVHERGKSPLGEKITAGQGEVSSFSVDQLAALLTENHALFDDLFDLELQRPGGVRAEALEVFQRFELAGQNRTDVIEEIAELKAARAGGVPIEGDPVEGHTPEVEPEGVVAARTARAKRASSKKAGK